MRSTQHGRARGNGKRVNQICHFGIMGGLAPLTGVPLAHRSYIQKHATTHLTIPPGCEAGRRWMMGHNPYRKYLLSKNPVGAGRVDVIKKSNRKCNCGPRPRGDGSQVGTHIFAELTPSTAGLYYCHKMRRWLPHPHCQLGDGDCGPDMHGASSASALYDTFVLWRNAHLPNASTMTWRLDLGTAQALPKAFVECDRSRCVQSVQPVPPGPGHLVQVLESVVSGSPYDFDLLREDEALGWITAPRHAEAGLRLGIDGRGERESPQVTVTQIFIRKNVSVLGTMPGTYDQLVLSGCKNTSQPFGVDPYAGDGITPWQLFTLTFTTESESGSIDFLCNQTPSLSGCMGCGAKGCGVTKATCKATCVPAS